MSQKEKRKYQVGRFWLDREESSSKWYIYWYDERKRKTRRKTTSTTDHERAKDAIDEHYYASRGPVRAQAYEADIRKILANYWLEHGRGIPAAPVINTTITSFTKFIDQEEDAGRIAGLTMLSDITPRFIRRFITWRLSHTTKVRKDKAGNITRILVIKKKSSPNTVQTYIKYIRAAINWAYKNGDILYCPHIPGISKYELNGPRTAFISIQMMADALTYARDKKMDYLFKFILGCIGTIARPEAVLDIHVGHQMDWSQDFLNLNPPGRRLTSKRRPVIAVPDLLKAWLREENGHFIQLQGKPVKSIKKGWRTMREELDWPKLIVSKTIRHSIAKTLRTNSDFKKKYDLIIDPWELSGHMGHQAPGSLGITEGYAQYIPDGGSTVIKGLNAYFKELEEIVAFNLHPSCTQVPQRVPEDVQIKGH
ncbi:phage integrase SAM-like domain-containing protein [Paremcibacter congregatus]|uniref:phage integrase SAM-like domain-containing protein n=1 Tax=Paremcibacter congregatus TaxID=2043170 RepID=UPI0030EE90A4|tara:strand:+ start:732 stop:2003 length:1272 start_codon:yes stop_codon:yes gene_type:complete